MGAAIFSLIADTDSLTWSTSSATSNSTGAARISSTVCDSKYVYPVGHEKNLSLPVAVNE